MTEHLIHIGYPKAGSTLLRQWFEAHPQILYASGGLAGFDSVIDLMRAGVTEVISQRLRTEEAA